MGEDKIIKGKLASSWRKQARDVYGRLHGWETNGYHYKTPDGYQLHHIDGDITNNSLDNLMCITKEEHDAIHSIQRKELQKYTLTYSRSEMKRVCCSNGNEYESIAEACRDTNCKRSNVLLVLKGKRKTCNGLNFWFIEGDDN